MDPITSKDLDKLKNRLNINVSDSVSALKSIIKIDNHNNLEDLFYKYFFVTNSKIKEQENQLYKSFDDDCQFKIVHGYSKNGKTTFINHILYRHNTGDFKKSKYFDHLKLTAFDFEKTKAGGFIEKVKSIYKRKFLNKEIESRKTLNKDISNFGSFINQFHQTLTSENQFTQADIVAETFTFINHNINLYLEETRYGNYGDNYFIEECFQENVTSLIDIDNCGNFFIFLIFFEIFCQRDDIICKEKCKLIFTLDNIDDYLENNDVSFFQHPQILLSSFLYEMSHNDYISKIFINELEKYSTKKVIDLHFSFQKQIAIVYVFRTANFLVFANLIQKYREKIATSAERYFSDLLLDKKYIHFKTVGNTSSIFDIRLNRFKEIADKLKMEIPIGYSFLKTLSDNFDSSNTKKHERNIRRIYNLWNGDKNALWKAIISNWENIEKIYFENESIIKVLDSENINQEYYKYILNGYFGLIYATNIGRCMPMISV
ncbi:hypothetical protein [Plebeiibacterium sediminum]|uniref:Uncharacterized protein n=1 Tax=Plebeiibacterium sediminum TaxID=2992112 RepID=A0AAE3SHU3_9BACT|nr:hypothetical protein [Plebeiobacterium sediminum]MCW3789632.1 hypothetical protein [Plebeiobacterium sediminum]